MMGIACRWLVTLSILALAACASAPTQFYTLLPRAEIHAGTHAHAAFAIDVEPVVVPAEVDQAAWLVRTGQGQVALLDNERWAAPLGDELRAAFADALRRDTGASDMQLGNARTNLPVYRILIDVRRFESVPGQYALIQADWTVTRRDMNHLAAPDHNADAHDKVGSASTLACSSQVSQPVEPGYAALAVGHQKALAGIADEIARAVRNLAAGKRECPQI
ncbi:MAG: PqiC family protein [Rudaea sp.]